MEFWIFGVAIFVGQVALEKIILAILLELYIGIILTYIHESEVLAFISYFVTKGCLVRR